jgi:hypothetical protein
MCQKKERVAYFTKGDHNAGVEARQPKHFGITPSVKEKIEDLIFSYYSRPKRLHVKLQKLRRKKKFVFDHMPTLKQIQDFINELYSTPKLYKLFQDKSHKKKKYSQRNVKLKKSI